MSDTEGADMPDTPPPVLDVGDTKSSIEISRDRLDEAISSRACQLIVSRSEAALCPKSLKAIADQLESVIEHRVLSAVAALLEEQRTSDEMS
jgi:hypothetical protein